MQKDERDLLEVLKFELKFLEDGGYGRSPSARWRPQLIFEDSPTCMNFNCEERGPCNDCVLIDLVPPEFRSAQIPCRHIPFASGETLDSLYRCGYQYEIEDVVGNWLRATIRRLEEERMAASRARGQRPIPAGGALKGTPLYGQYQETTEPFDRSVALQPKCANPTCPIAFNWTGGGKFFRFQADQQPVQTGSAATTNDPTGVHRARHYWLCESCSQVFTLVYEEGSGVVLKTRWPEIAPTQRTASAA